MKLPPPQETYISGLVKEKPKNRSSSRLAITVSSTKDRVHFSPVNSSSKLFQDFLPFCIDRGEKHTITR